MVNKQSVLKYRARSIENQENIINRLENIGCQIGLIITRLDNLETEVSRLNENISKESKQGIKQDLKQEIKQEEVGQEPEHL